MRLLLRFFEALQVFQSDMSLRERRSTRLPLRAHRFDEPGRKYPLAGCSPAEPTSVSRGIVQSNMLRRASQRHAVGAFLGRSEYKRSPID